EEYGIDLSQVVSWANDGLEFFGFDVGATIEEFLSSIIQEQVLQPVIQDKFKQATGHWKFFDPSQLTVENVEIVEDEYLQIDVQYDMNITFPFVNKTLTLKKTSYERLWKSQ